MNFTFESEREIVLARRALRFQLRRRIVALLQISFDSHFKVAQNGIWPALRGVARCDKYINPGLFYEIGRLEKFGAMREGGGVAFTELG